LAIDTLPPVDASPERQLWCAVLGRALEDALGNVGGVSGESARERASAEAKDWFLRNGDDFRRICDAAGFEAGALRRRVIGLIAAPLTRPGESECRPIRSSSDSRATTGVARS
jgi:hypothetical protein